MRSKTRPAGPSPARPAKSKYSVIDLVWSNPTTCPHLASSLQSTSDFDTDYRRPIDVEITPLWMHFDDTNDEVAAAVPEPTTYWAVANGQQTCIFDNVRDVLPFYVVHPRPLVQRFKDRAKAEAWLQTASQVTKEPGARFESEGIPQGSPLSGAVYAALLWD